MIESLQLGSLALVGERRGPLVEVRSHDQPLSDGILISPDKRHSLLALADTKLAGEREVERLRAELLRSEAALDACRRDAINMDACMREESDRKSDALAAMTKARDEACDLLDGMMRGSPLVSQLRRVGRST